jgi:signal peptidase
MEITVESQPRRSGTRRAGRIVGNLLILAVFLGAAAYLLPSLMGYQRYIITGGSMTGTYDKGSVVFERMTPRDELEVGDVITYVPPPSSGVTNLVTHRIYKARNGEHGTRVFHTWGDANPAPDPWTFSLDSAEQPVVAFSVPYVGWALLFLADPHHRMWLIGGPAALVALLSLVEAGRNARKPQETDAVESAPTGAPVAV